MKGTDHIPTEHAPEDRGLESNSFSRRQFLKIAGVAGATVGLGAGLGGLVVACGGTATGTTAGNASSTAGAATTQAATASTTASAAAEAGREIKLGLVSPETGAAALLGRPTSGSCPILKHRWRAEWSWATARISLKVIVKDSQSDSNRASQVAGDLVNNDKVDMMLVSGSPETVNPVADQGEAGAVPCLSNFTPWPSYVAGRSKNPEAGFHWTYTNSLGSEQAIACFIDMFEQMPNNKVIGMLFCNDADGNSWWKLPSRCSRRRGTRHTPHVLPGRHRGLHGADNAIQKQRLRNHLWHQ